MDRVRDDPQGAGLIRPAEEPAALEDALSVLLRGGVVASTALILSGMALSFVHHPEYLRSRGVLSSLLEPVDTPRRLADVFAGLLRVHGQSLVMAGLLLLIVTPIARVAFSLSAFALRRDRAFMVITGVVLSLLLTSFLLGHAVG